MSLLTLHSVGQNFGDFDVFKGLCAAVPNDARIGLVGPNGIGKTSLLLILSGLAQPTAGYVGRARGVRIGYLRQEAMEAFAERDNTVYEEMMTVFADVHVQEARMRALEAQMADGNASDEVLDLYGKAIERFEEAGGYDYDVRIAQTLEGLGFRPEHWELPLNLLSGGQKTRALLARLLLEQPDLLILDEPTNHLDTGAVAWLEQTLRNWKGALLVVSHDRYFLDNVANTIWEMSRIGIESYRGNYSAYLRQRQERYERNVEVFQQEKERLENELEYIRRNIARASTNGQAVGRLKRLSRDLAAIEAFGIAGAQMKWSETGLGNAGAIGVADAERKIRALQPPNIRPPRLNLNLKTVGRGGDTVLRARDMVIGYPERPLFTTDEIVLVRGEVAALVGPNGTGKTTFLKTLLGQLQPLDGKLTVGANIKIGYFAQAHDRLDLNNTVIEELTRHRPKLTPGEARSYLAQFLFRGDDAFKPVHALSGGERARLALAILALDGANFLLLDEPTNHLDIPAQEALQETLEAFEGTVLLVSHDRYLVDQLATQVWDLHEGHLHIFNGSYREYVAGDRLNVPITMF